jgi:hypothetical protein
MMSSADLYRLRQKNLELRQQRKAEECQQLAEDITSTQRQVNDCLRAGDTEGARANDEWLMELESNYQTHVLELQSMQPQGNQLTEAKLQYVAKHADQLQRPHWSGVMGVDGRMATNLDALAYGHDRALALGLREDSPEYFAAIDALAPQSESALPTPDEAARISGVSGRDYNAGVRRLISERQKGIK